MAIQIKVRPLYIFARTDLATMTPGRIAAQVAHAANMFAGIAETADKNSRLYELYAGWKNQTLYYCGTTIVLNGGSINNLEKIAYRDLVDADSYNGWFIDPEYGIRDGDVVHLIKDVPTTFFSFPLGDEWEYMKEYPLL